VLIERHLQGGARAKEMWRYVSNELRETAVGDDTVKFSSVLEIALSLEGLEWDTEMTFRRFPRSLSGQTRGSIRAVH
jgi:hypothetical protein